MDLEAVQAAPAKRVPLEVQAPQGQHSLVSASPASVLKIVQPLPAICSKPTSGLYAPKAHFGHQTCKRCGRFVVPDNSSGIIPSVCGTCQSEKAESKPDRFCSDCQSPLDGHESKQFCSDCSRARAVTGQRRQTKTSKTTKANRAAKVRQCQLCAAPLPSDVARAQKYCPDTCAPVIAAERQRECIRRHKQKKMARDSGTEAATPVLQPAECAESGIPLTTSTTFETSSPSNPFNVVNP